MMGAVSTTVCAHQASMDGTVSTRLDPVSRQGEYGPLRVSSRLAGNLVTEGGRTVERLVVK